MAHVLTDKRLRSSLHQVDGNQPGNTALHSTERRASPRISALSEEGLERARLLPGRTASVVDLSSGGALIETDWRLLPGTRVELQVGEPAVRFKVAGHVLRCHVWRLDRERIRYRGAVVFEQKVPFGEVATPRVETGTRDSRAEIRAID